MTRPWHPLCTGPLPAVPILSSSFARAASPPALLLALAAVAAVAALPACSNHADETSEAAPTTDANVADADTDTSSAPRDSGLDASSLGPRDAALADSGGGSPHDGALPGPLDAGPGAGADTDAGADASIGGPRRPFPQHVTYATASIRPNHRTQAQLDDRVATLYRQWKARYLVDVANTSPRQAYVFYNLENSSTGTAGAVSCSEGHGYGMLLAAYLAGNDGAARADFNALSRFYDAHRSSIEPTLMGWQQVRQGANVVNNPSGGTDSATDGDLDIAYAFLVADNQWGSTGTIDYRAKGVAMLRGISHGLLAASDKHLRLGDWVRDTDVTYGKATRTSDFFLGHLKAFEAFDGTLGFSQARTTTTAIASAQMARGGSSATGLLPDFMTKASGAWQPVASGFLEGNHDGDYHYNACRVPWRLGTFELTTGDRTLHPGLASVNAFIRRAANDNPHNVKAGYRVSTGTPGQSYANYEDLSFTAPFLVSAGIDPQNQAWMNSLWDTVAEGFPTANSVYFGNSIRVLSVLVASGNWWVPVP